MSRPTSLGEYPTPWEAMVRLRHQAQRFNRLYGITGALLVSPHWFLHTLEGEPASVYATLARINLDLRQPGPADLRGQPCASSALCHFGHARQARR
jgi:hypothetical protein